MQENQTQAQKIMNVPNILSIVRMILVPVFMATILYMNDIDPNFLLHCLEMTAHGLKIGGTSANPAFCVSVETSPNSVGKSTVNFDSLAPSGNGNCTWEYNSTIGKYILVKT